MKRSFLLPALVMLAGAAHTASAQTPVPVNDTLAVQRAVTVFLMTQKAYHTTGTVRAVCLSLGASRPPVRGVQIPLVSYVDPGAALLKSLAKAAIPVVPGTHCQADPARAMAIVDSASRPKRAALAIVLSPVRISADGKATLLVDRAFDVSTAMGFICTASRGKNGWVVDRCVTTWNT